MTMLALVPLLSVLSTVVPCIVCTESAEAAVNPGFRGRVTQHGLDYARDLALDILMDELQNLDVPDIEGDVGVGEVTLSNILMDSLPRPEASIVPVTGVGLRWQSYDLNPTITANYKVRIKLFNIKKRGSLTASGSRMSFKLDFVIGRDEEGRLSTYGLTCDVGGDITLEFSGGWSDALNIGSDVFRSKIRDVIHRQICSAAKKEIEVLLKMELQTLPVSETVAKHYSLDFSLTQFPTFDEYYLEAHHKGTVSLVADPQEPLFSAPPIPAFPDHTDRMLYFYLTDYVINSGLDAAYRGNKLAIDLRSVWDMVPETGDIPGNLTYYMRTACPLSLCVGTVFPELEEKFPLGQSLLQVYADQAPHISIASNKVFLLASGKVDLFVDNSQDPTFANETTPQLAFSVNMTITAEVAVRVNNTRLFFELIEIEPVADVLESHVGDIGTGFFFETMIRVGTQGYLVPLMKEIAEGGIELPKCKDIDLINPTIINIDAPNVVAVGLDIQYTP